MRYRVGSHEWADTPANRAAVADLESRGLIRFLGHPTPEIAAYDLTNDGQTMAQQLAVRPVKVLNWPKDRPEMSAQEMIVLLWSYHNDECISESEAETLLTMFHAWNEERETVEFMRLRMWIERLPKRAELFPKDS